MADVTGGCKDRGLAVCMNIRFAFLANLFQHRKLPIILLGSDLNVGFASLHAHPECLLRAKSFCPLEYFFI